MADGTGMEHVPQLLKIYVAAGTLTIVSGSASMLLATSDGAGGLSIVDEDIMWSEQGMVDRKSQLIKRDVTFTMEGLTFKATTLDTMFSISSSATASMHDSAGTTATARRISDTTTKQYMRLLIQYQDSDLGESIEWYFPRTQISGGMELSFDKTAWNQQAITFKAFAPADGGGDIMEQLTATPT